MPNEPAEEKRPSWAFEILRVDMRAIIEARQRSNEDSTVPYLDLKTGEVVVSIDEEMSGEPDEVQALFESDPESLCLSSEKRGVRAATHEPLPQPSRKTSPRRTVKELLASAEWLGMLLLKFFEGFLQLLLSAGQRR